VIDAVKRTAQLEGVLLDPVYTGKAMAALFDLLAARARTTPRSFRGVVA
jgi:1-aminocyclopropane-1-carboxylate deaminase/D-cysteine desulfhydrase-like pyridoxal-dependent ACC family enzyme